MTAFAKTRRNHVLREAHRGHYEREDVYRIVDEGLFCHVGFVQDGQPFVIPTLHAREGDTLMVHGSSASRMIKHLAAGHPACVTVTLVDGIVLARSVFNHSINYRSAVLFGRGRLITDAEAKLRALARFTERLVPGRWDDVRPPTPQEFKATGIVAIAIDTASAKIRVGPPKDEPDDVSLPIWAGVLPIRQVFADPIADPHVQPDVTLPGYLGEFYDGRRDDQGSATKRNG